MLSSLFPRSSIYKSLDDRERYHDEQTHAFNTGNNNDVLFEGAEDGDDHVDHAVVSDHAAARKGNTVMTDNIEGPQQQQQHSQRPHVTRHNYSHSIDPFEQVPKTATFSPQIPHITTASPQDNPRHHMNPFQTERSHSTNSTNDEIEDDDPMAAMNRRLNTPFSEAPTHDETGAQATTSHLTPQAATFDDGGPPKSIMFEANSHHVDNAMYDSSASVASQSRPELSTSRHVRSPPINSAAHMASSSHILQRDRSVPWWLRQNRKRIGEMANAGIGGSIRLDASTSDQRPTYINSNNNESGKQVPENLRQPDESVSAATHTMFLPTHNQSSPPRAQSTTSGTATSSVKNFVRNVYHVAQDSLPGGSMRQGPIHLQNQLSKKDKALWNWVNVDDLDSFLQEVYTFYVRKGIWSIALAGFLDLLTIGFVIGFSIFLLGCVDYSVIRQSHSLGEVVVPRCVSRFHGVTLLLFLMLAFFYAMRIIRFGHIVKRLFGMRDFFTELLAIPESDIQTVPWPVIVDKVSVLRAEHPAVAPHQDFSTLDAEHDNLPPPPSANKPRLDAHDVANRIMRKENYLVALFNKNVLNLAIPITPMLARSRSINFLTQQFGLVTTIITPGEMYSPMATRGSEAASAASLTRVMEWNLTFCLLGFLFGPDGQVRRQFVSERNKKELVQTLQRRFILMGCLNAIFAPFILLYLIFYSFFRYFEEYHKNPSSLGTRSYTQLARWKFREFNELPHLFQMRLYRSYPLAEAYVSQFPNDRVAQLARFIAFISGSFASVLVLFSLLDPDAFLHFEITTDRTVLFYIGIFGSVMAIARGMVPDDHRVVDPEALMKEVIEETHYMPPHWRGNLHSADVHRDFGLLFPYKIVSFLHELLSILTTPLVLWFTLPRCSAQIIDFFREFTIHVDGLGYVCSFAVFDFAKTGLGDVRYGAPAVVVEQPAKSVVSTIEALEQHHGLDMKGAEESHLPDDISEHAGRSRLIVDERHVSDQGKLEKSILGFKAANPDWQPQDQSTSLYLSRMTDLAANSIYLAPGSSRGDESIQYRSPAALTGHHYQPSQYHHGANSRSGSRSALRRSKYYQPSPFTSPIFEDEPNILEDASIKQGQHTGGSKSIPPIGISSVLDRGRHRGQMHHRQGGNSNTVRGSGRASQQQQFSHGTSRYKRHQVGEVVGQETINEEDKGVIEEQEEQVAGLLLDADQGQSDDDDPYIRPDERQDYNDNTDIQSAAQSTSRPASGLRRHSQRDRMDSTSRTRRDASPPEDITGISGSGSGTGAHEGQKI